VKKKKLCEKNFLKNSYVSKIVKFDISYNVI
jgi:hypothetical protein